MPSENVGGPGPSRPGTGRRRKRRPAASRRRKSQVPAPQGERPVGRGGLRLPVGRGSARPRRPRDQLEGDRRPARRRRAAAEGQARVDRRRRGRPVHRRRRRAPGCTSAASSTAPRTAPAPARRRAVVGANPGQGRRGRLGPTRPRRCATSRRALPNVDETRSRPLDIGDPATALKGLQPAPGPRRRRHAPVTRVVPRVKAQFLVRFRDEAGRSSAADDPELKHRPDRDFQVGLQRPRGATGTAGGGEGRRVEAAVHLGLAHELSDELRPRRGRCTPTAAQKFPKSADVVPGASLDRLDGRRPRTPARRAASRRPTPSGWLTAAAFLLAFAAGTRRPATSCPKPALFYWKAVNAATVRQVRRRDRADQQGEGRAPEAGAGRSPAAAT